PRARCRPRPGPGSGAGPVVELLVLGDELLESGLPRAGRVRDALGPLLPHWLRGPGGADVTGRRLVSDDLRPLYEALRDSTADVVVTTGSTAAAPHLAQLEHGLRVGLGETGADRGQQPAAPRTGGHADAEEAGIRVTYARTGLVVAREGGAWGRLFPVFRAGLGGRMGDGRQYWSFISLHDEVAALRHLVDTPALSGPVNLTAPEPVTNREVTAAMGRVLRRPTLFTVPAPALKVVLGDFAQDVLGSQRVLPGRLLETGFDFAFPTIDDSIRAAAR
ncbi:DUF1731 domain-containing protein, partial [Streptomyces massasporeus]